MTRCGGTLLQIHYHNRPGGVATVLSGYARAFGMSCPAPLPFANILVCSAPQALRDNRYDGRIIDVGDCEYRSFRTRPSFAAARSRLLRKLVSVINDSSLPRPVMVVGHNLNLGKNCALSSAFAGLARQYTRSSQDVRFFSVVHDFAEQGRTDLLDGIRTVRRFNAAIEGDLYPQTDNLSFVAPSGQTRDILKKAGFPVMLVPNPAMHRNAPEVHGKEVRTRLRVAMLEIAKQEKVRLRPLRPVLLYPSRVIARKNPVEAVLVSHVMLRSNLLLGATGASSGDKRLSAGLKRLCRKHGIPVLFDAGRIAKKVFTHENCFQSLYECADLCVSTSLAEGYGYAIHECAQWGKNLIGRAPRGVWDDEAQMHGSLYCRLLVPIDWVDTALLKKTYYRRLKGTRTWAGAWAGIESFSMMFDAAFTKDNGIDFGCLDAQTQLCILERCITSSGDARAWKQAFSQQTAQLLSSFESATARRLPGPELTEDNGFSGAFCRYFCRNGVSRRGRVGGDAGAIRRHFSALRDFPLLMSSRAIVP